MLLTIAGEDVTGAAIYDVSISTGRSDVYAQPDSSVLGLRFVGFASAGRVGDELTLSDEIGQLFHGWITLVETQLQDDMSWQATIQATGPLAVLGRLFAGYAAYPVESDSQRVKRIVDETLLAGALAVDVTVEGFPLAPRLDTTEPVSAAELARQAAESAMGVLWESPSDPATPLRYTPAKYRIWDAYPASWGELPPDDVWGEYDMAWHDADSDSIPIAGLPPALELDPSQIFADVTFEQSTDDLVRTVKVNYGADDADDRPEPVLAGDGRDPSKTFDTLLNELGDATRYAETMLERRTHPAWRLSSLAMDLAGMTLERQTQIREALQVGTRITLTIPHGSPVGTLWQGFLEGWEMTITGDAAARSFFVALHISDRFLTEPATRWLDGSPAGTWSAIPDGIAWQQI